MGVSRGSMHRYDGLGDKKWPVPISGFFAPPVHYWACVIWRCLLNTAKQALHTYQLAPATSGEISNYTRPPPTTLLGDRYTGDESSAPRIEPDQCNQLGSSSIQHPVSTEGKVVTGVGRRASNDVSVFVEESVACGRSVMQVTASIDQVVAHGGRMQLKNASWHGFH